MRSMSMQHEEAQEGWQTVSAPHGVGECLAQRGGHGEVRVIAPPGVILDPRESTEELTTWRLCWWRAGQLLGSPRQVSMDELKSAVASRWGWVQHCLAEQESQAYATTKGVLWVAPDPSERANLACAGSCSLSALSLELKRETLRLTELWGQQGPSSASAFSASLGAAPADYPPRRVARAANRAPSLPALIDELEALQADCEREDIVSLVAQVLHARSRSHSWLWTTWMVRSEPSDPLLSAVGQLVDRAPTCAELERSLLRVRIECPDGTHMLDGALVASLHMRSRSVRWRATRGVRRMLAWRRLRVARGLVRVPARRLDLLLDRLNRGGVAHTT
jgi:hypothetical protein